MTASTRTGTSSTYEPSTRTPCDPALGRRIGAEPLPAGRSGAVGPSRHLWPRGFRRIGGVRSPAAGTGGDKTESWPPTDVDWPPGAQADSDADKKAASMPIVQPKGTSASAPVLTSGDSVIPPSPIVTPGR